MQKEKEKKLSKEVSHKQIKRAQKYIKKWHDAMGLSWWEIHYNFLSTRIGDDVKTSYQPGARAVKNTWEVIMSTACDPFYMSADIDFYLPVMVDVPEKDIEESLLHEYMHIILSSLRSHSKAAAQEEMVATWLARVVLGHGPAPHEAMGKHLFK